jgi:VWFA-related protein
MWSSQSSPKVLSILLFLTLALVSSRGDDRAEPESQMVDLNVIALDSHGAPITDLTRDDFEITDAGKRQQIVFFRHNESNTGQVAPVGPDEISNRRGENVPHATVVLLDFMNQSFNTRGIAANQLARYLEGLESSDYLFLYILTIDGRIYAVHGLPDPNAEAPKSEQTPWTKNSKQLLDQSMREVLRVRPVDMDVAVRTQLTYRVLEAVAANLSRVPGRKNLVWITDGVPIELGPIRSDTGDFVDFTPMLRQLSAALDRSRIAIYPVRQVMLGSQDGVSDAPGGGGQGGPVHSGIGSIDTLDQFAAMTGGRPDAGKDIGGAIKQAMSDLRTSYQIGYYPPERNWDSKLHKLKVICKRKGVRIQAKTLYFAWPEPPGTRTEEAVRMAGMSSFDAAEIGLRATAKIDPKERGMVHLEAHIDANDVVLVHEGDQWNGQLRVVLVTYQDGSQPSVSPITPLDLHYNGEGRDQALKQGIPFVRDIAIGAGVRNIRLIVFDRGSDTVGSVTMGVPATGR